MEIDSELLCSLRARLDAARSFPYNVDMQIEAKLLEAQIAALERRRDVLAEN